MNTTVNIHWHDEPVNVDVVLHDTGDVWLSLGTLRSSLTRISEMIRSWLWMLFVTSAYRSWSR